MWTGPCNLGDEHSLNTQTPRFLSDYLPLVTQITGPEKKQRILSIKNLFALNVSSISALLLVCFFPMSLAYFFIYCSSLYNLLSFSSWQWPLLDKLPEIFYYLSTPPNPLVVNTNKVFDSSVFKLKYYCWCFRESYIQKHQSTLVFPATSVTFSKYLYAFWQMEM